jgi:DNA ligase-1
MRRFVDLLKTLARTGDPPAQEEALAAFLRTLPSAGGVQALCLMAGVRPRRCVTGRELLMIAAEQGGLPSWLVDLSAQTAEDIPEAAALLLGPPATRRTRSLAETIGLLCEIRKTAGAGRRDALGTALLELPLDERMLLCRLATGAFRPKVSRMVVLRLLARQTGLTEGAVAHRLASHRHTAVEDVDRLLAAADGGDAPGPPYVPPPITTYRGELRDLGDPCGWHIIGCPRGRRCQIVRREGAAAVWTGELEDVSRKFPGFLQAAGAIPDGTVVDGFLLSGAEAPAFTGIDLLEHEGRDMRGLPHAVRQECLADALPPGHALLRNPERLSCATPGGFPTLLHETRARGFSGLLIGTDQVDAAGVPPGWLILTPDPFLLDVVLLYVEPGGAWTFGVRDGERWLPVASADPDPCAPDSAEVDDFVRTHTLQRFGPVRALPPTLVFTLAFDDIRRAPRRRSGFTLVNPVLHAMRRLVPASAAATLDDLRRLHESPVSDVGSV